MLHQKKILPFQNQGNCVPETIDKNPMDVDSLQNLKLLNF